MKDKDQESLLISELIRDEGEILHAYQDSLGYWTIGVGRLIDSRKGGGITKEESRNLLSNDIKEKETHLDQSLPWWRDLSPTRQRVLLNMTFNLGIKGLLGFKNTLQLIKFGQFNAASEAMLNSKWAKQVGSRANRLAQMMKDG